MDSKQLKIYCREVAEEGCVLLENDGTLPFLQDEKIAIFGREQFEYVKSGSGSGGLVNCEYVTDIHSSLCGKVRIDPEVEAFYKNYVQENPRKGEGEWAMPAVQKQPELCEEFVKNAASRNDKALLVIARSFGEGSDMKNQRGEYLLTEQEENSLSLLCRHFKKVAVVINSGNVIDLTWIKKYKVGAVLMAWQGGQEGGAATASLLVGEKNPSGKLPIVVAELSMYDAFPFGQHARNIHAEDIFVGYRYALTFAPEKIIYPFGYGLSYTKFQTRTLDCIFTDKEVRLTVEVTNVGERAGKEVVQTYFSAPQGKLGKAKRELVSFAKTDLLAPKEKQTLSLKFAIEEMCAFDDKNVCGFGHAFIMEQGNYEIFVGNDCIRCEKVGSYTLAEDTCIRRASDALHNRISFQRLTPFGKENVKAYERDFVEEPLSETEYSGDRGWTLQNVTDGACSMDEFIAQFKPIELSWLVKGEGERSPKASVGGSQSVIGGITEVMLNHGVPVVTMCDGPSGARARDGKYYTCIPAGTMIAATWNPKGIKNCFVGLAEELRNRKIDVLLGPGMNIQRHPFCGRNFEYFSEDPYLTGVFASCITEYLQENGVMAVIKHFAVNSQENGRDGGDEVVSERALREIYLKGFEKVVRNGKIGCIMTSYNRINGISTCANADLTDVILRREWGYNGLVISDWWAQADKFSNGTCSARNIAAMVKAQNDVQMVCNDVVTNPDDVMSELENGGLTVAELQRVAKHALEFILKTQAFQNYKLRKSDELTNPKEGSRK